MKRALPIVILIVAGTVVLMFLGLSTGRSYWNPWSSRRSGSAWIQH